MQKLEWVGCLGALDAVQIWQRLQPVLGLSNVDNVFLYGKKYHQTELLNVLTKRQHAFNLQVGDYQIHFAHLTRFNLCSLQITKQQPHSGKWWLQWLDVLLGIDGFIQAWVVDVDYNYWQNATDPVEYQAQQRSFAGLAMKPNGLPPPLNKMVIDTSANLGLRELADGYIAAIGAQMWLSQLFFTRVGTMLTPTLTDEPFSLTQVNTNLWHLDCGLDCFTDSSSAQIQQNLRRWLYR